MATKAEEYIARLERRADHLARRVAEKSALGRNCSYDAAELTALYWAIKQLHHLAAGLPPYVDRL